jgi:hypothetical protein
MDVYNAPPLAPQEPAHFYWQEGQEDRSAEGALQAAFES